MIAKSNAAKKVVLGLTLVLGAGLTACEKSDGLPKVNQENCGHMVNAQMGNTASQEKLKEFGLSGDENKINRDIFNEQCNIWQAEEIKKTGIFMGMKAEGEEKEELNKEMDKEIAKAKAKIEKLQAEKKAAQ